MAKLIKATGEVTDINPKDTRKGFTLQECYDLIDCSTIEVVYLPKNKILIVDEEATLKSNQIVNVGASVLAGQFILGNAIYCYQSQLK